MTENIDVSPLYNAIYGDGHFEQVRLGSLINKRRRCGQKFYLDASHPKQCGKDFSQSRQKRNQPQKAGSHAA